MVRHFPVLHFPDPAIPWEVVRHFPVLHFQVVHFQSPPFLSYDKRPVIVPPRHPIKDDVGGVGDASRLSSLALHCLELSPCLRSEL